MRRDTDLQAVSIALIGALSFVFSFEAIYKLSFYFQMRMPPDEVREFIIQCGITLTALAGFAFEKFRLSRLNLICAGVFALGWAAWLLAGYPQLGGRSYYANVLGIVFTYQMTYALNRATKFALCLVYFFLYTPTIAMPATRTAQLL